MTAFFQWINSLAPAPLKQAHPEVRRFVKFAIVGGFGAIVDFTVLNILVFIVGVPKEYANLVSVTCAIISNFTWNRLWTFPESQEHALHTQFGTFFLMNLIGLAINQFVFLASSHYIFEPMFPTHKTIDLNLAKAVAIGIVLFWNFGANRLTTYRHIK